MQIPPQPASTRQAQLGNGLRVILKEIHSAPVISTWLWYRVGSRNEVEGHTGMSHWVEHMMFKGSRRFPKGSIMRTVDRNGGYVNAMTSFDFTAYYMTLPSDRAELALEIEADRITGALFDPAEVSTERTVIIAEREGSENEPRYVLAEEMAAAAFRVHPYHHQTIGWKEDLLEITREELLNHYQSYYGPNNALLVVAGDLDPERYLASIETYFGAIRPSQVPQSSIRPEPPQRGERRVTLRMPGSAPMVRLAYHTPPVAHADYIPMVVLDAVLSGGKAMFAFSGSQARSARLYRALVETQLASSVGSNYHPSLDPYLLTMLATVREGRELQEVEGALVEQITLLCSEPVSERELSVAIRQTQAQFAYSSESVTSQALTLGFLDMVDRHERMETILDELRAVTPDDIRRVARTYLHSDNAIVGHYIPILDEEEGSEQVAVEEGPLAAFWRRPAQLDCHGAAVSIASSAARRGATISPETVVRRVLANGTTVLILENPASASVAINASLQSGSVHDRDEQVGLAAFTAAMLRRGTRRHNYGELNQMLDDVGAEANFSAGHDEMGFGGYALAEDVELLIDHLAEIIIEPTFPQEELEKLRGQYLTHLTMLQSDTGYRADQAFMAALYPSPHPYGRPVIGTRETLLHLRREDLVAFHATMYHPLTLTVCVAGAVQAPQVLAKLDETFGHWQVTGDAPCWDVPPAQTPEGLIREIVSLPAKAQVDLSWGVVGMPRRSPDYYAAMMANLAMGRLGMAGRLGENIRDNQGLAYYISSGLHAGRGAHPWNIVAGVNPDDVERAVESILAEVTRLREDGIRDEELDDCRSYLTGALPLRLETNDGIANYLLNIEEHGLGLDYLQRYAEIIHRVTQEEIRDTIRRYLTPDRNVLAMAGTLT
ncbi:MAG: insulinase family protein [Anaerolineae bacterium]|nr:insulinase family protein [Anaerolineae bacterium]